MKKTFLICLTLTASLLFFQGCSDKIKIGCTDSAANNYDDEADDDDGSCTYAGTGGNVNLVVKATHHNEAMVSDSFYLDSALVKFNVQNL